MPRLVRSVLTAALVSIAALPAAHSQTTADSAGIRAAAMDYLDGFYLGDSTLHLRSIRPEVYKYGYSRHPDSTTYHGSQMAWPAFQSFTRGVREGRIRTPADPPKLVRLLDVQDQTAAVRVDAWWGSDYLLLGKHDGRWMIGHVAWQSPPKGNAAFFAPTTVSVGNVYRGSFEPDGHTFYYFKKTGAPASEVYAIFRSRQVNGRWSTPDRVNLGGDFSDLYPTISSDGRRMVFSSYRPAPGDTAASHPNAYLWYADKSGDGWGPPVFMGKTVVFGHYHPQPFFGPDGAVYFNRSGAPGSPHNGQFITRWNGREFDTPTRWDVVDRARRARPDLQIFEGTPSPDGSFAILTVAAADHEMRRRHPADLWVTFRTGSDWSEPRPLAGTVNTSAVENFPFFSPDGQRLYFVRDYARVHHVALKDILGDRPGR
jgi:hypothetical protein